MKARDKMNRMIVPCRKVFGVLMLMANGLFVLAQSSDWGLWTSLDAEMKFAKKWEVNVTAQYRMNEHMSNTDQIRGSTDISLKTGKYLKFGAGYEMIAKHKVKTDTYVYRNRFKLQSTGSYKYARFTAGWRSRMQFTLLETDRRRGKLFEDESYEWVWRNRFSLKYNIKKSPFTPYTQFESFHRLFQGMEQCYYKNRLSVGMVYQLDKHHGIDTGYKLDNEVVGPDSYTTHIVNIGYIFTF